MHTLFCRRVAPHEHVYYEVIMVASTGSKRYQTSYFKRIFLLPLIALAAMFFNSSASAAEAVIETTAAGVGAVGLMLCAALVFFMQSGFALLESGSVRAKNSVNVIMKNYTDISVGIIVFWLVGYGLMFGGNSSGLIGTSGFLPSDFSNAEYVSLVYQMMFAATAATIVSGAVAERMRYWPYVVLSVLITGFIYPVFGSWVWNSEGWLAKLGFIDLAGSTVVHAVGGWCALAAIIVLGPRTGRFGRDGSVRDIPGHNLPNIALGGFILWFGWFGFNAGSAGSLAEVGGILLNTQLGAAGGALGALLLMIGMRQPVLMTHTVNGVLAGLVSSCAGAASIDPIFALLTGLVAGALMVQASQFLLSRGIDDVVGAVSVHAVAGSWGTLAAGIFHAEDPFNPAIIGVQALGIIAAVLWAFFGSLALFKLVDRLSALRASKLHEQRGLDYTEHYEIGYAEFQSAQTHQGKSRHQSLPAKQGNPVTQPGRM